MATSRSKKWVPIMSEEKTDTTTTKKTALIASRVGTNFKEWEAPAAKKTPAKEAETTEMMKECIARVRVKILACAADIQETVMELLGHCLVILQECNKTACFVNAAKTLEAHKLANFPQDFTEFHDEWGQWDKPMKSFLNMMPKDRGQLVTGSFYFQSKWEPIKLFEKTLFKMAGQTKHKGTIMIQVKQCQYLDTEPAVIFSNLLYCSVQGLWHFCFERQ
jgi:hypothetical protein